MRARAPGAVSVAHPLRLPSATPPHEPPALGFAAVGSQGRRRERPPQQADEAGIEDLVRSDARGAGRAPQHHGRGRQRWCMRRQDERADLGGGFGDEGGGKGVRWRTREGGGGMV